MDRAVNFDGDPERFAVEVEHVGADGMLAPELQIEAAAVPDAFPQNRLGGR
jgi:hypothetical protein